MGSCCKIEDEPGLPWHVEDETDLKASNDGRTTFFEDLDAEPHKPHGQRSARQRGLVRIYVTRRPRFYINNYVSMFFVLTLLSLGVFAVQITDITGRNGTTVTFLLTAVSFKLRMGTHLPKKRRVHSAMPRERRAVQGNDAPCAQCNLMASAASEASAAELSPRAYPCIPEHIPAA